MQSQGGEIFVVYIMYYAYINCSLAYFLCNWQEHAGEKSFHSSEYNFNLADVIFLFSMQSHFINKADKYLL